jgi:hypothetical protein
VKSRLLILHDCRSPLPLEYIEQNGEATARHDPDDRLLRKGARWERRVRGRLLETYEARGTLTLYLEGGRAWTRLPSRDGRLRLRADSGADILVDIDPLTGLARWSQNGRGRRVHYRFEGGFLRGTRTATAASFQYDLSSTGDIVQAKEGSFATEAVTYDEDRDRVLRVERAGGCAIEITYQNHGVPGPRVHARKLCPERLTRRISGEEQ